MKLKDIIEVLEDSYVLSNGEFSSLGLAIADCEENLLSFIESEKYISGLSNSITCLITNKELGEKLKDRYGIIVSSNPRVDYFKLHNALALNYEEYKVKQFDSIIGENTKISPSAIISSNNVVIGSNVIIEDRVIIRENVIIKDNSIIRAGCILGGEGYEFKRVDDIIMNVIHCGGVIIEENVELQYGTCVDKALYTWDNTVIGEYSKLDNMVHIEHAVKVGKRCLIASRSTVGGRTIIGNDSWVGLGAIISNGLKLGNKCYVALGSVVTKNIKDNEKVSGNFAISHEKFIENIRNIR